MSSIWSLLTAGIKVELNLQVQLEALCQGIIHLIFVQYLCRRGIFLCKTAQGRPQPGISNESPPSFPQYLQLLASGAEKFGILSNCIWICPSIATQFLWKATSASTWTQLWQIANLVLTAGTPLSTWRLSTRTARLFSGRRSGWYFSEP